MLTASFRLVTICLLIVLSSQIYPDPNIIDLETRWGKQLNKSNVLHEYPHPQFSRESSNSYLILNGIWNYAFLNGTQTSIPTTFDGEILVPFSPETPLSGVKKQLTKGNTLWYYRSVDISSTSIQNKGRFILYFGAVDQYCEVYINKNKIGEHFGGYLPFNFDITNAISPDATSFDLYVSVVDNLTDNGAAYGKQTLERGNIWYTATSGIWQTVWIESVPEVYITKVKITPNYDDSSITFKTSSNGKIPNQQGSITIYTGVDEVLRTVLFQPNDTITIRIENFTSWSPENPYLYNVSFSYGEDNVMSYFGMRKFSIDTDSKGKKRLFLNNKPYFHNGLLDQGYWSDGYYTAPSDEALIYDIQKMKDLGFNMLRKHIKIEPLRWYYHCDRLGMLVWQDAVSGGTPYYTLVINVLQQMGINLNDKYYSLFGRSNSQGRDNYYKELGLMIDLLYNTPSIATWVPFNEGWGQFDAKKAVEYIKHYDTTRHIDHASGWHDQKGGDFRSLHIYFKPVKIRPDTEDRAIVVSEFGGYSYPVKDHVGSKVEYGYTMYQTKEEFNKAYEDLYRNEIIPNIEEGISATVYTQVSDVEDEINGMYTYDRQVCKVNKDKMKELAKRIYIKINA